MKLIKIEPLKIQGFKLVEKDGEKFLYAKISETRMFDSENTGRVYLDLVGIESPNSEYSDYIVKESKKQDEEIELPIIGDMKNHKKRDEQAATPQAAKPSSAPIDDDSALPF